MEVGRNQFVSLSAETKTTLA